MKKNGIINTNISETLSNMRHTDSICISDLGLPCPDNVKYIDISLKIGFPSFIDVLEEVYKDLKIEHIILAEEIKNHNKDVHEKILKIFNGVSIEYVSHNDFKKKTQNCKAIIRSGEATPYANIILQSACIF
ncbi:D-ribose pyranase [Brachyspira pilosicoli]|uniref:D-ribose pyranase n=1 Tax=Brachyspira pilosicoli P43/6/78 TaxID=1042417 RepID=A0A3B6VLA5_BRAPL|nr:D-ribose pyranase [Brachyspira pilosicoli]AGA66691.1 D-ribose pyranase [Brachyspira pilosicoli P43/6/78]MBW5400103.1 D-ribose pyranase [Brachyspira pilosicoli]WIH82696.1 D-ribose pyranase [Brachyspira pilosicoli]